MPFDLAVAISFLLLAATGAVALTRLERARRHRREERLRGEARARGWQFESVNDGGFRLLRWRGVTDGITWTAEYRRGGHRKKGAAHHRTHRFVWRADTLRGPASPVLFMGVPHGAETPALQVAQGNGLLARLAQKAAGTALDASVDAYFGAEAGAEVNAAGMRRLESGAPPGFIVMAADPSEGARLLFSGWTEALAAQVHDPRSALSDDTRPWVLLLRRRVSLARMAAVGSAGDAERFARAGAALVKRT